MSIRDRLAAKSANIEASSRLPGEEASRPVRPKTAPGQLMSSLPFLAEKEQELRAMSEENEKLKEQIRSGKAIPTEARLSELHEVAGRRRRLTDTQYQELRENLRRNPLVQAVTISERPEGGYNIISGHNRVAIFRELGRETIAAVLLKDASEVVAESSALYANLFQPDLTDYEKYLGFKKLIEQTGKTQKELAKDSGADEKSVSRWMAFGDLPKEALAVIDANPSCIGGKAVMALTALAHEGRAPAVIAAVEALAEGKITQDAAVRQARDQPQPGMTAVRPEPLTIRQGKKVFCKVVGARSTLRIDFQSAEARAAAEAAIHEVLRSFAANAG